MQLIQKLKPHHYRSTGILLLFILLFSFPSTIFSQATTQQANHPVAIAVHGGAGSLKKLNLTPQQEQAYKDTLAIALQAGYAILKNGGTSVDAVAAAIKVMEDCTLFNAGRGSVLTHNGSIEMDAAIMNGKNQKAGAVAGVKTIRNPITLAKMVLDSSKFVLLAGRGAEEFARDHGIAIVDTSYFFTPYRRLQLQKALTGDTTPVKLNDTTGMIYPADQNEGDKFGTVGCVAIDRYGNVAAGTSTGGTVNKNFGRIGDSPLIGCGTYANNKTCAVSCTGHGEDFIRHVVAYDISAMMQYRIISLHDAANYVIKTKLTQSKGSGGCIAIDRFGHIEMPFNTEGMFRGYINTRGQLQVMIY
ncbi:MAG TPA: isoaspartyl peptidase/L-asparaginase [Chitinophagales bacterium]|nr:isoaspartyl peptidase/L-asparaginase [Chitinophagales bacterium]